MRYVLAIVSLTMLCALASPPPTQAGAPVKKAVCTQDDDAFLRNQGGRRFEAFRRTLEIGAQCVRIFLSRRQLDNAKALYKLHKFLNMAQRRGLNVHVSLLPPRGRLRIHSYSEYVRKAITFMGARITRFSPYNEPNCCGQSKISPEQFRVIYFQAYDIVKGVAPSVEVTTDFAPKGLLDDDDGTPGYLRRFLCVSSSGGQLRPSCQALRVDILGLHPYTLCWPNDRDCGRVDQAGINNLPPVRALLEQAFTAGLLNVGGLIPELTLNELGWMAKREGAASEAATTFSDPERGKRAIATASVICDTFFVRDFTQYGVYKPPRSWEGRFDTSLLDFYGRKTEAFDLLLEAVRSRPDCFDLPPPTWQAGV